MMTRYSVWLDNIPLHGIHPSIYVLDIQETTAQTTVETAAMAGPYGTAVLSDRRERLDVTVSFAIRNLDPSQRKAIMSKIHEWARSGTRLSISDRPGMSLGVRVDKLPTVKSALKWTEKLDITFTAYAFPFWVDDEELSVSIEDGGTYEKHIPGNGNFAPVNAVITAKSDTVTVSVDGKRIVLSGISTGTVVISHDNNGYLRIMSNGASILSKRTAESADDLIATPGRKNTFSVTGGAATFSVRGVWT